MLRRLKWDLNFSIIEHYFGFLGDRILGDSLTFIRSSFENMENPFQLNFLSVLMKTFRFKEIDPCHLDSCHQELSSNSKENQNDFMISAEICCYILEKAL